MFSDEMSCARSDSVSIGMASRALPRHHVYPYVCRFKFARNPHSDILLSTMFARLAALLLLATAESAIVYDRTGEPIGYFVESKKKRRRHR